MKYIVVYDDRMTVPGELRNAIGVAHFGQLVYRKRSLRQRFLEVAAEWGAEAVEVLTDDIDAQALVRRGQDELAGARVAWVPANLVIDNNEDARVFFTKMRYSRDSFRVAGTGIHCGGPALFLAWDEIPDLVRITAGGDWSRFETELGDELRVLDDHAGMRDLGRAESLGELVSSTFDARHFNRMEKDELYVTKRSSDRDKMRREYHFYEFLPRHLRLYFLEPLAFLDEEDGAGYRLERLHVPDMAIQWIHGACDPEAFAGFMARIAGYFRTRPVRPAPDPQRRDQLYRGKLEARLATLCEHPAWPPIERLLREHSDCGGIDALGARYHRLYERLMPAIPAEEAVTHGDLCFSNILYGRENQVMKFIDPRGADQEADLWLDAGYDAAKLAHSVLGCYDLINHDRFELRLDADLHLKMELLAPPLEHQQEIFIATMEELGFPRTLLRLGEASLFLSMLPLHIDVPKKVVGFVLTAERILTELETRTG
ncbi:MAG: phosphotransferase [Planctomycetota bacterium]